MWLFNETSGREVSFLLDLNRRICEEELQPFCSHKDCEHDINTEDFGAKRWKEYNQILVTLLKLQHEDLLGGVSRS